MFKFNSKRDVDRHVSQMSQKLNENERSSRGFAIARSYAKVNEYELARDWLQRYLDNKPDDAAAHKFMGEIYERLQKSEQAITSYQRSYNLNSKQNDIIKHVCRLFLLDNGWSASPGRAKYWCELAETENIRDDSVFNLRLKMANKDKKNDNKPVEEMILREIASRPQDVGLRVRLVKFLLEEKRLNDAFKYCFDLEMKCMEIFLSSLDWYTTVSSVLTQNIIDSWNYWCLLLITLEKQIYLNLKKDLSLQAIKQNNIKEVTNLLFEFDQVLKKASDTLLILAPVKELADEFINHFRGQMALHIASLLFQKQKISNDDKWRETTKKCLPFLLFAFQCSTVNTEAFWLKNTNDTIRNLLAHLKKEGAFRCTQAARTILACKAKKDDDLIQGSNQKYWFTVDDIFNQARETCADLNWRKIVYRLIFANADQQSKITTSYFVQNSFFQEPLYDIISFNDVESFEDMAQYLYPSSLDHHVYLGLGRKDLSSYSARTFNGLNLSTSNLINCNPETINRIDIDSFLYCSIIQAKRRLEAEKNCYETFNNKPNEKPMILPAANIIEGLCTEEQNEWWLSAFKIYKNISGENMAQLKATLQFGIEAVRGIDTPKIDVIILLKLGDLLLSRSNACSKSEERRHLELRVEYIYKFAIKMMRNREIDNMRRLFKYPTNNIDIDNEIDQLMGSAIGYLSGVYFKREEYKEFIDDLAGVQNAWAHFFRAEAYKKLDEMGKTPKKTRKLYIEKARENLVETLALLDNNENIDKNNPLRIRVEKDLKKLQYDLSTSFNEELDFHNASQNGYTEEESFHNASSSSFRGRRDASFVAQMPNYNEKFSELEGLIRKLNDLVISVKDDVLCVRNDITGLRDDILNIRGDITDLNVNKDATTSKAVNDIYKSIEDLTWNVTYMMNMVSNPNAGNPPPPRFPPGANALPPQFNQMYNTAYPIYQMQYPGAASRPQLAPQIPSHLQYNDSLGVNLIMNASNYNTPIIPSPQLPPPAVTAGVMNGGQKSSLLEALNTPSVLSTWNNTYNQVVPTTLHQPPPSVPSVQQPPPSVPSVQQPPPSIPAVQQPPQPQPQPSSQIAVGSPQTIAPTPTATTTVISNKPVEKAPPVNVVITSSDPLPAQNTVTTQPTLSVIIPPQHIKHSACILPPPPSSQQQTSIISSSTPFNLSSKQFENVSPAKAADTSEYYEETDYDPRPDFKPIIPLPDEVEVKTGEEDENVLFCHRSKLLRFDANTKEWKERGIGEMKVLVSKKDPTKGRLLMRREQVLKLCCNMPITKELKFVKMNPTAVSFGGQDFSDGEMKMEKLTIKFKTSELIKSFQDAVLSVQKKLADAPKPVVEKKEAADTKKETKGFGDMFKPKPGSWTCETCYVSNKPDVLYCASCESPKDDTVPKKGQLYPIVESKDTPKFNFGMPNTSGFTFGMPQTTSATSTSTEITKPAVSFASSTTGFQFGSKTTASQGFSFGQPPPSSVGEVSSTTTTTTTTNEPSGFKFDLSKPFSLTSLKESEAQKVDSDKQVTTSALVPTEVGKSEFTFVFKKKSPAKAKSPGKSRNDSVNSEGGGEEAEENEYHEEEENQTYFTPVIPLPEKVDVVTGEENETVLYSHRSKLFRFTNGEWKERGIGDIKILKHQETGKLRVVMRRDQVLKICLNCFLTDDIEFKRKDDQSWTFGANDFSEGEYEPTSFAIRFKNKEIAEGFKKAIDDALSGAESKTDNKEPAKTEGETKESNKQDEKEELINKLQLPATFFDYQKAPACPGCIGCKSDEYVYSASKETQCEPDLKPIQLTSPTVTVKNRTRRASQDKRVSFKITEKKDKEGLGNIFGGTAEELPQDKAKNDIFGIHKSEATVNIFAKFNQENPPQTSTPTEAVQTPPSNIFNSSSQNVFGASPSIFSSSLNTTPTVANNTDGNKNEQSSIFGNKTSFTFGSVASIANIFGGGTGSANKENKPFGSSSAFSNTPVFGGNIFGSSSSGNANKSDSDAAPKNIFGSSITSTFSFAEAAKDLDKSKDDKKATDTSTTEPGFMKNIGSFSGFAEVAAATANTAFSGQNNDGKFIGLTVKDDFFSKNLNKQNTSTDNANTSQNDDEHVNDDNYDPHYEPIISLPDEIKVSTGEEDEEKIFGDRAKLYRYDVNTKEWKERGIGELKILHHAKNKTYRMILRREQIFKLVLNQLINSEIHMAPMENSPKAFCWAGMNYAEGTGEAERLAIRFKNENIASSFKTIFDDCLTKLESNENLHPEND